MKRVSCETHTELLISSYPIEQWWRLFIDGYAQYSPSTHNNAATEDAVFSCQSCDTGEPPHIFNQS